MTYTVTHFSGFVYFNTTSDKNLMYIFKETGYED